MKTLLPSNPTTKYIPMRNTYTHQKMWTRTFTAALFATALNWKLSKCPLALERKNEMWYIYKVEHQAATRMNDLVTRACSVHKTWSVHLRLCAFFVCMLQLQYGVSKRNGKRSCSRNSCPRNVLGHKTEALPHPCPKAHPGWLGSKARRTRNVLWQPPLAVHLPGLKERACSPWGTICHRKEGAGVWIYNVQKLWLVIVERI